MNTTRRTLLHAAWATPAVTLVTAAPAAAGASDQGVPLNISSVAGWGAAGQTLTVQWYVERPYDNVTSPPVTVTQFTASLVLPAANVSGSASGVTAPWSPSPVSNSGANRIYTFTWTGSWPQPSYAQTHQRITIPSTGAGAFTGTLTISGPGIKTSARTVAFSS